MYCIYMLYINSGRYKELEAGWKEIYKEYKRKT